MAKEKFYRTKPHVNAGVEMRLAHIGFSAAGVWQITSGQMVTDPQDRKLLVEVLTTLKTPASGQATGKRQHKEFEIRPIDSNVFFKIGFSAIGARQITLNAMVTDSQDRLLIAEILTEANMAVWYQPLVMNES